MTWAWTNKLDPGRDAGIKGLRGVCDSPISLIKIVKIFHQYKMGLGTWYVFSHDKDNCYIVNCEYWSIIAKYKFQIMTIIITVTTSPNYGLRELISASGGAISKVLDVY